MSCYNCTRYIEVIDFKNGFGYTKRYCKLDMAKELTMDEVMRACKKDTKSLLKKGEKRDE